MTLKQLCDLYLQYQHSRVLADELTPKHYNDQISSVRRLAFDQAGLSSLLTSASLALLMIILLQNRLLTFRVRYTSIYGP